MTSVAWNRHQLTIRTRDGINEATHPPVKHLEIQLESTQIRSRLQQFEQSILLSLGHV